MSGPTDKLTREIRFTAYKASGKWYSDGKAWVEPGKPYFNNHEMLADMDRTNTALVPGALLGGEFFVAIIDDQVDGTRAGQPFLLRLIKP